MRRTFTREALAEVVRLHGMWWRDEEGGARAVLTDAVLTGAVLTGAVLTGAVLTGAVLTGAVLTDAVLTRAVLTGAVLTGAVPRGAPAVPQLHTQILAALGSGGELNMREWHTCDTTHCRAGWAIHLAGDEGKALEDRIGSAAAGALIHVASCPWLERVPDFYASNANALADIQACAAKEAELAATATESTQD